MRTNYIHIKNRVKFAGHTWTLCRLRLWKHKWKYFKRDRQCTKCGRITR